MTFSIKENAYADLVAARKKCRFCMGVHNPAEIEGGVFDSEYIGPWTGWQGNRGAKLMVVGQDWGGHVYFTDHKGREEDDNETNRNLRDLLNICGIHIDLPPQSNGNGSLYFTNAILCCREGRLTERVGKKTGGVKSVWFRNCEEFLKSQIEIVNPRIVVTLGYYAYRGVLHSFGKRPERTMRAAVENPQFHEVGSGSIVVPVYHCGKNGQRSRTLNEQRSDWNRVSGLVRELAIA